MDQMELDPDDVFRDDDDDPEAEGFLVMALPISSSMLLKSKNLTPPQRTISNLFSHFGNCTEILRVP